ncbi:MAG: cytochrome C oxidase subunit IV family protein [Chloroflexota bacterium]
MADPQSTSTKKVDKSVYRRGNITAIILAVITVVEFVIADQFPNLAIAIILLAAAKAYFVINVFMGLPKLWSEEEH